MPTLTPKSVYRAWEVDGVPDSGKHDPKKGEIIQLLEQIQNTTLAPAVVRLTKADLDLVTPADEAFGGQVLDDPDPDKNGYYYRDADAWIRGRGFPDTFAKATFSGTGSAQAMDFEPGVNPADVLVYFGTVVVENTGPFTLGGIDVVNAAGNVLSAGEWAGTVMLFQNGDGDYQLLFDAGAMAAAAQGATNSQEWAQSPDPISVGAGGDGVLDRSSKYWSILSAIHAADSQESSEQAAALVVAATSGFSGFIDGLGYDFGSITETTTYFDQDWGTL